MKKVVCCVLWVVLAAGAACAQNHVEVFGGYAYERLQNSGTVTNINLNGWNAAVTLKRHWYGATADFSGLYGTPTVATIQVNQSQHTFLFGPQVSVHLWKLDPFAHALFGISRLKGTSGSASSTATDMASAIGGGLDVGVWPHLGIRLGQVDYFRSTFASSSQNNVRVSAGLVARF